MIVFHKASCITCKRSISEIEETTKDLERRDFFRDPFTEAELKKIIRMSGKKPSEILRKRDKMYKELRLEDSKKTDAQLIRLMVKHPGLILRPIIVDGKKVTIGRV